MQFGVTVGRLRLGGLVERYRRIGLALAMKQGRSVAVLGTLVGDWPRAADRGSEAVLGSLPSTSGLARQPEALAALVDDGSDQLPRPTRG